MRVRLPPSAPKLTFSEMTAPRERVKIPPQPPSFLPARAFSLAREARHQLCSKKVRISSNKRIRKNKVKYTIIKSETGVIFFTFYIYE